VRPGRRARSDRDQRLDQVDGFVRALVRGGLLDGSAMLTEARTAVAEELPDTPDAGALAEQLLRRHRDELRVEQQAWPETTDHDRLQTAFAVLSGRGVLVLQGCQDHWAAASALERPDVSEPRGVVWFTMPDVWHAVDEPMLEVNLWHPDTANAAPGDALLDEVLEVLAAHGLAAGFDEGRIEVAARWQRRL
jgi:hypothetical protein